MWFCVSSKAWSHTLEAATEGGEVPGGVVVGAQPQVAVDAAAGDVHGQLYEALH